MNWTYGHSKSMLLITLIIGVVLYFGSCTNDDQLIEAPMVNGRDLVSVKVTTPPVIDGTIDEMWENSPELQFETVVPDPGGDIFRGYIGNTIPSVILRSAYDDENIYFLAEWWDPTQSLKREPWYFDLNSKRWKIESGAPLFATPPTTPPTTPRAAFYEDKIAMLWNIDNSVSGWDAGTCYKSCHANMGANDGYGRHHTNNPGERIDMWHWKSVRGGLNTYQFDDQYQDNSFPNGRKSDSGAAGYTNNTQKLVITGSVPAITVNVPKYFIPNRTDYNWIMGTEITDGTARLITTVDSNGVLTYDGGIIDPTADTDFRRDGATVGAKAIPYIYMSPFDGSRGDITCKGIYTGTGWVLEYKRALSTGDTESMDVDFSSLDDQSFGFAIFENAQIAHSIKTNLVLKFNK
ncbi:MAG TPA: ethylbenzene dehydrogenase-related protein [Saprospiraceae bacterium]|nr:ethylbenzene dehydrogenase-related protein [Saprospiraceae bacterium]